MYEDFIKSSTESDLVGTEHSLPNEFRGLYPNIALAVSGRYGSKSAKTKPLPPASISFRAADGGMRFTVTPQGSERVIQGFIADPSSVLDQIEQALADGFYSEAKAFGKRS